MWSYDGSYNLQVVAETMDAHRNEAQEEFMANLIANGTLDDGDDGIPDDGGDAVTATFLNDSGEGAENIYRREDGSDEEEDPNGSGEEEDHHNGSGDGTVVIT